MSAYAEGPDALKQVSSAWWLLVLLGLLCGAAGIIVLVQPDISLATLAVVAGVFLLLDGVYDVIVAIAEGGEGRGMLALVGIVSAIAGIILVRHPIGSVAAIALLVGIWLVCIGVVRLIRAFALAVGRGWNLFVAFIEIVAGIVIVSSPDIGVTTLAILVGIAFIVRGIGLCAAGWVLHTAKQVASSASAAP